jgi:hypothetical protein
MSGTRRTEDFNTVKTRQLIMQNPDNTFPPAGQVMTVLDNRGTIGPSDELSVSTITTDTLYAPANIQTTSITVTDIQADTIEVDSNLTANRADITYLYVHDLSADCITVGRLIAEQVEAGDISASSLYLSGGLTSSFVDTTTVNTMFVNAVTIDSSSINTAQLTASDISCTLVTADTMITTSLRATDISSSSLTTDLVTASAAQIDDISAGTIRGETISAYTIQSSFITDVHSITTDNLQVNEVLAADIANITTQLNVADISAAYISTEIIDAQNLNALNILATNATITGNFVAQGSLTISDISVNTIRTNSLITESILAQFAEFNYASIANLTIEGYYFDQLTVENLVVNTGLVVDGFTTVNDISATGSFNVAGSTTLSNTVVDGYLWTRDISAASLYVSGHTQLTDVSAETLNVAGKSTFVDVSARVITATTSVTAPAINATNYMTIMDPNMGVINSGTQINPGVLTYNISGGLYLNGSAIVPSILNELRQEPFSQVQIINGLATVTDISNTLIALTNSYNSFLALLNSRNIIIQLVPIVNVNSTTFIQFVLHGVPQSPIPVPTGMNIIDLTAYLTGYGGGVIGFEPNTVNNIWSTKLTITNPGGNSYIADVSGMPTGSLQVLRILGFSIDISTNSYATYVLSGSSYVFTPIPLVASIVSGASLASTVSYPNTIAVPSLVSPQTVTPYSTTFTFQGVSSPKYTAIQINASYTLYPVSNPILISGLAPNTAYPYTVAYLDDYNNRSITGSVSTIKIPFPTDISSQEITFNSFDLTWTQPYPGKTYSFIVDVSGDSFIVNGVQNPSITLFPLVQNRTYIVYIRSLDTQYQSQSDQTNIVVTTDPLLVPEPFVTDIVGSNIQKQIAWDGLPPTDVSAALFYRFDPSAVYTGVLLEDGQTSYEINATGAFPTLFTYLQYDDHYNNIVDGTTISYSYNTSFGFDDYEAVTSSYIIDVSQNTSLGYVFPAASPWIGFTFNRIQFTGTASPTAQVRAIVYSVPPMDISGIYSATTYDITGFNPSIYSIYSSSNIVSIGTSTSATLIFPISIIVNEGTMILFSVTSATGQVSFLSFDQTVENNRPPNQTNNASTFMTAILLNSSGQLTNSFGIPQLGTMCLLSYI